jgi:phenylalanyl-tRNA synthetase beta chain
MGLAPAAEGDVALQNPLASTESHLRRAVLPGLGHRLEHNLSHGLRNVRLFEIGTAFERGGAEGLPAEATHVAAIFTGARQPPHWTGEAPPFDVWDVKGLLAELAALLGLGEAAVEPGADPVGMLAPGLAFRVAGPHGQWIGHGGQLAEGRIDAPAWAGAVWGVELRLSPEMAARTLPKFRELPAFPAIERDLALLVGDGIPAARVEETIRGAGGPVLQEVAVFDLYRGKGIPEGARSIAFRLRFRAPDRTLTDQDADRAVDRVLRRLKVAAGVRAPGAVGPAHPRRPRRPAPARRARRAAGARAGGDARPAELAAQRRRARPRGALHARPRAGEL